MAVNFQRRNVGVLADIPTFADVGQSAYVDYGSQPVAPSSVIREETAAPETAPAAPTGPLTPEAAAEYERLQREYLARAEVAAERQRKAAGNPLNVIGSVLSGVIGTPFSLLENAVGGGQNDLTAPFTPKQNAQDRYTAAMANIGAQKLALAQKMDGMRSSQAQALQAALADKSKILGEGYERVANLAMNAGGAADPTAAFSEGMAYLMQDPVYGPALKSVGLDKVSYSPDLARKLAYGKDIQTRLDDMNDVSFGSITENGTGVIYNKRGDVVRMIQYGDAGPAGAPPPVSPQAPAAELPPLPPGFELEGGPTQSASGGFLDKR